MPRLLVAAVVLLAWFAVPSRAFAGHVDCGDVITEDTTLDSDVVCHRGDPGVIAPDGERFALLIGADGVRLDLAGHSIVTPPRYSVDPGLQLSSVGIYGHDRAVLAHGELYETVKLHDAHKNRLIDLDIARFQTFLGGVELTASRHNLIRDIRARSDMGLQVSLREGSDRNVIERSTFYGEFGIRLADSDRNLVRHNTNDAVEAIEMLPGADRNVISQNRITAFEDGILVWEGARHNRLSGNVASGAADDGIDVNDPTTVLVRNTANNNGDLGIEAVAGVFGRGNRASGNGNPLQCTGVVCK